MRTIGYLWPKKWVLRLTLVLAAAVCTWSVMNAGWLMRTGTQILPMELMPWIRDPLNITWLVAKNIAQAPGVAAALFIPSGIALAFVGSILVHPVTPAYRKSTFMRHVVISLAIVFAAAVGHAGISTLGFGAGGVGRDAVQLPIAGGAVVYSALVSAYSPGRF